jgi:hypothetical protein
MRRKNLDTRCPKTRCEIENCQVDDPKVLHRHHIIERVEVGTSNHEFNLCVLCPTHHSMVHTGRLKILGVYPSTGLNGRTVVYELDGKKNIEIDEPYFKYQPPQMKIHSKEEHGKK